jgi:hypothetical protein
MVSLQEEVGMDAAVLALRCEITHTSGVVLVADQGCCAFVGQPISSSRHAHPLGLLCVQVFFCKYNDPIYVKMEKLEIMIQLASERNIDQVLLEFKEYAQEVDVDFVRKVRSSASDVRFEGADRLVCRCVSVLACMLAGG